MRVVFNAMGEPLHVTEGTHLNPKAVQCPWCKDSLRKTEGCPTAGCPAMDYWRYHDRLEVLRGKPLAEYVPAVLVAVTALAIVAAALALVVVWR